MRAILRTDHPEDLPDDILVATKTMDKLEDNPEGEIADIIGTKTFALVEGISGAAMLKDDVGVRLFLNPEEDGLLHSLQENEEDVITHGGENADYSPDLVSCCDDDAHFKSEPGGHVDY